MGFPQIAKGAFAAPHLHASSCTRAPVFLRAYLEYPDPALLEAVKAEFPDKGVANVEEARALYSNFGYTYVDVRPALEVDEVGKFKGAVHVPFMNSKKVYNAETRQKDIIKSPNAEFISMIKKKFPKLDTPLLIGCSDGKAYSIDALMALDEAGYTNIVGLQGGYYRWFKVFDNNLRRRRGDGYTEAWESESGDSCGIHGTGAGFERMDKIETWVPPQY